MRLTLRCLRCKAYCTTYLPPQLAYSKLTIPFCVLQLYASCFALMMFHIRIFEVLGIEGRVCISTLLTMREGEVVLHSKHDRILQLAPLAVAGLRDCCGCPVFNEPAMLCGSKKAIIWASKCMRTVGKSCLSPLQEPRIYFALLPL